MQFHQKNQKRSYLCVCGDALNPEIDTKELAYHFITCQVFQQQNPYANLLNDLPFEDYTPDQLYIFRYQLIEYLVPIEIEVKSSEIESHLLQPQIEKAVPSSFQEPYQNRKGKPENLYSQIKLNSFLYQYEGEQLDIDQINEELSVCSGCHNKFYSNIDLHKIWYLQNCLHVLCKECLANQIKQEFIPQKGCLKCKKCNSELAREDFLTVLSKRELDNLDNQLMEQMCNFVNCMKCNEKFDFQRGDDNSSVQDKDGKQLDKKHLNHYIENRFVCQNPACKTEQCKSCKLTPYHLGLDCNEFKKFKESKCRYCDSEIKMQHMRRERAFQDICQEKECSEKLQFACNKVLQCGHPCCGFKNEVKCPPCLFENCAKNNPDLKGITGSEYCNICYVEGLSSAPIIQSNCGHIFHYECVSKKLQIKQLSPSIVFTFCLCPLCKQWLQLPPNTELQNQIDASKKLFLIIKDKALKRLQHEKRDKDKQIISKESIYFNKPDEYAMAIYQYYMCFKCQQPYFGGQKDCERALNNEGKEFKPSDLICPNCCDQRILKCQAHGDDFLEFKCRYCCSIAIWFCHGTTHYCEPCHNNHAQLAATPKNKLPQCKGKNGCPFSGDHNQNGDETNLGCSICRNIKQQAQLF